MSAGISWTNYSHKIRDEEVSCPFASWQLVANLATERQLNDWRGQNLLTEPSIHSLLQGSLLLLNCDINLITTMRWGGKTSRCGKSFLVTTKHPALGCSLLVTSRGSIRCSEKKWHMKFEYWPWIWGVDSEA